MSWFNPNLRVLDETKHLLLGNEFEYAYLINKRNSKVTALGDFYGDPSVGLISSNEDWCLVCGDSSVVWRKDGTITEINDKVLSWVIKVRQISDSAIELLIDPWSENGAVWQLDVVTLQKRKLRDFRWTGESEDEFVW